MRGSSYVRFDRARSTLGLGVRGLLAVLVVAAAVLHASMAMAASCDDGSSAVVTSSQPAGVGRAPALSQHVDRMDDTSGIDVCCTASCVATPADCPGPEVPLGLGNMGAEWWQGAGVAAASVVSGREPPTPDLVSMLCVSRR